jgi:hypothetical protein
MFDCTSQDLPSGLQRALAQAAIFMNQTAFADTQIDHINGHPTCQMNDASISKIKNNTLFEHYLNSNGFTA